MTDPQNDVTSAGTSVPDTDGEVETPEAALEPELPESDADESAFRLGYVPGATPAKWARVWRDRLPGEPLALVAVPAADAATALAAGALDAALVRLPVDKSVLSAIALYAEVPVVVVSAEHTLAALDPDEQVALDDLDDEVVLDPLDAVLDWTADPDAAYSAAPGMPAIERPETTAAAVELVAAGVGVLVVPKSLARLHHRKDVTYRELTDGPLAPVGLAWATERTTPLVEELVGIVRGRTANSSRGSRAQAPADADSAPGAGGKSAAKGKPQGKAAEPKAGSAGARRAAQGKAQYKASGGAPKKSSGARGAKGGKGGPKGSKGASPRRGR